MVAVDSPARTVTAEADPRRDPRNKVYQPYGHFKDFFYDHSDQIVLCGPSGTGKSRAALEKMHLMSMKYPGMRSLIVRKTRASLTQSALVTYEKFVMVDDESVHWRTGEQEYRYSNGSVVAIGGMDKAIKVMSSEYDWIYAQEATELTEEDWETLYIRCRHGVVPYQQLVGDCNPSYPSHWIKRKGDKKEINLVSSVHQDNPAYFDPLTQTWTPRGLAYLSKLQGLSGVRLKRFYEGVWAAAEGMIYTTWNPDIHLIPRFPIPRNWARYWVIDFGYTNPFVWQAWASDDHGHAYRFAEIYQRNLLVEDAVAIIKAWKIENEEPDPIVTICDWDAEDRATFERHMNVETVPAVKDVLSGIHTVMSKLRPVEDGKPGLMYLRDSVLEPDTSLIEEMRPYSSEQEYDGYEWENQEKKETPRKVDDHGMDTTRYLAMHLANYSDSWSVGMG
jgi:phage terminase large subunit